MKSAYYRILKGRSSTLPHFFDSDQKQIENIYRYRFLARNWAEFAFLDFALVIYALVATILNLVPCIWDTVPCIRDTVPTEFSLTSYL